MSLRTIEKAQLDESYVFPSTRMDETIRDHTRPQDAKKRTRTRWGFVLYALIGVYVSILNNVIIRFTTISYDVIKPTMLIRFITSQ